MNPELPQVKTGAETAPQIPGGVEYHPETAPRGVEIKRSTEQSIAPIEQQPIAPPTTLPPVAPTAPVTSDNSTLPAADDSGTPLIAADEDLIEKEWVDKAKKILAETRDDPYRRESEVSKLQIEYIRKRYGREIGAASEE